MNRIAKRYSLLFLSIYMLGAVTISAQPLPPPPDGGPGAPAGPPPPPAMAQPVPPGYAPPPPAPAPSGWGAYGYLSNPPAPNFNQGVINVMATGYDTESVLVQIPLVVSYSFNGVNYNVSVVNCWNPYTQSWTMNIDEPAYQTTYYFNGFTYNYYTNLPSGTFYFNL